MNFNDIVVNFKADEFYRGKEKKEENIQANLPKSTY